MRRLFRSRSPWFFGLVLLQASSVFASTSGTTGFSFLNIPDGARATAMGEAFVSVPNDVQGLSYNPACLATMAASQASFQHLSYVEDTIQENASYGYAGRRTGLSWGLSADYLRVGSITRTVALDPNLPGDGFSELGQFSTYDVSGGASVAGPVMDDLFAGATVKYIKESLADASSTAGAVDLGILYQASEERSLNIGAAIENLGFASKFADAAVQLPTTARVGFSGQPFSQWLFSADFARRRDTQGQFDVGAEVTPTRGFAMRVGYQYQLTRPDLGNLSGFTAGVGLRFDRISVDYAFVPLGDLGLTHRISINFRFKTKRDDTVQTLTPGNLSPAAPVAPTLPAS